jgi:hypothetical protein
MVKIEAWVGWGTMLEDRTQEHGDGPKRLGLPAGVWRLGWISFFADVASEMVYPLLPLFLTHTLRASAAAIGLIEGFADAIVSVLKGWSGWRSDATASRVPFVRWGYGLGAVAKPLLAMAVNWQMVWGARTVDRLGKGLRTSARDALMAETAPKGKVGAAFGLHRAMDTGGAFVGVGLAMVLLALFPTGGVARGRLRLVDAATAGTAAPGGGVCGDGRFPRTVRGGRASAA